jgi:RNA-dependent RNA polymerase
VTTEQGMDPEYEDDDEDEDEDEDHLSPQDSETFMRAAAAWQISFEKLSEEEPLLGPASFGLIALGLMLDIVKKARKLNFATDR